MISWPKLIRDSSSLLADRVNRVSGVSRPANVSPPASALACLWTGGKLSTGDNLSFEGGGLGLLSPGMCLAGLGGGLSAATRLSLWAGGRGWLGIAAVAAEMDSEFPMAESSSSTSLTFLDVLSSSSSPPALTKLSLMSMSTVMSLEPAGLGPVGPAWGREEWDPPPPLLL